LKSPPSQDFGIEEILPALKAWAREKAKVHGRNNPKSSDPMSALWALSAYRLHKAGGANNKISEKLNALPRFRQKRLSFDEDGARKAVEKGKRLVEEAKQPPHPWAQFITEQAARSRHRRCPSPDISCSTRHRPYTVCSDQVYRFNRFGYPG